MDPTSLAVDASNGYLYVTNSASMNVSIVNATTNAPVGSIQVGGKPAAAAVDADNGDIYVSSVDTLNVTVIDGSTNQVVTTIPLDGPTSCATPATPKGGSLQALLPANLCTGPVATDESTGYLYVSDRLDGIRVIDGRTNTVVGEALNRSFPQGLAVDEANGDLYATNSFSGNVSVLDTANDTVVASLAVGVDAYGVAVDPSNGDIYVANEGSNNVSVISGATNRVIGAIAVGSDPVGVAADPQTGFVYVTDWGSNTTTVINGTTDRVVGSIPVGDLPTSVAVDPARETLYVGNGGSNNVSAISLAGPAQYAVAFAESGLANGSTWSVTLNHSTRTTTNSSILFVMSNGTFSWTATAQVNQSAVNVSGSVDVSGQAIAVAVVFAPPSGLVVLAFREVGLAGEPNWSVTLSAENSGVVIETATFVTRWSGGSDLIAFHVSDGEFSYAAGHASFATIYGTVNVSGRETPIVPIAFVPAPSSQPTRLGEFGGGAEVGIALVVIAAVGLGGASYRSWALRRSKGRRLAARLFSSDWTSDARGDPVPRRYP